MKIEGVYFEYSSIQMSSCYQTVDVYMPFSHNTFHSMGVRPILPETMLSIVNEYAVRNEKDRVVTTWYPNTQVIQEFPDETVKIWYGKPTLSDAVLRKPNSNFIQFHKGGIVTAVLKHKGVLPLAYYWSADMPAVPVDGPFETGYDTEGNGWTFTSDESDEEYDSYYYRYGPR